MVRTERDAHVHIVLLPDIGRKPPCSRMMMPAADGLPIGASGHSMLRWSTAARSTGSRWAVAATTVSTVASAS